MVMVAGIRLRVLRGVFNPSIHFTSSVLARFLARPGTIRHGESVLDLGTGTGVVAIAAALAGAEKVMAIDINPDAVRCASINVRHHGLQDQISVREGDMFGPADGERFHLVVCNPPYFRGEPRNMAERAYHAGQELEWIKRFGDGLADHLEPNGSAIISIGDAADIPAILAILSDCGWSHTVAARRDILVEKIYLFRLTPAAEDQSHAG